MWRMDQSHSNSRPQRGSVRLAVCAALVLLAAVPLRADESIAFFERRIRPLLVARCVGCHGPKKQESGLRLDIRSAALKGGLTGPAVVAGKPRQSLLIQAVRRDTDLKMPPDKPLSASEIAWLVKWVESGAPWPEDANSTPLRSAGITDEDRRFWSFQPVADPPPPAVNNHGWCRSPLDRFVLARIEAAGKRPSAPADKRSLIRRATLDLTGLPPTPQRVAAFVNDHGPDAFARLVDELLSSPAYGERWGRHWLDVVRYCDSRDARHTGQPYDVNEAWRYRDWVVDAFNQDRPYDAFVRQQIAGDYAPGSDSEQDSIAGLVASGMLVIGEWGSGDADAKKMYTDIVDDQIHVVSQTFMGLSLSCARCHDHKFDPFSTRDYYALAGIFFSTQIATPGTDAPLMRRPLLTRSERLRRDEVSGRIAALTAELADFDERYRNKIRRQVVDQAARYLLAVWTFERHRASAGTGPDATPWAGAGFAKPAKSAAIVEYCRQHSLHPGLFTAWHNAIGELTDDGELLSVPAANYGGQGVFTWKTANTQPLLQVNTTQQAIQIPGTLPAKSLAVHPTPNSGVALVWHSPINADVRVSGRVSDAHPGGNGVEWCLEHDRGLAGEVLASGVFDSGGTALIHGSTKNPAMINRSVRAGDQLRLIVLPRNKNHICDLTRLELRISEVGGAGREWSPERDVVEEPQQGNPHTDAYGNPNVWSFVHMSRRSNLQSAPYRQLQTLVPWFEAVQAGGASAADHSADQRVRRAADAVQRALQSASADRTQAPATVVRLLTWLRATDGFLKTGADLNFDDKARAVREKLVRQRETLRKQLSTTAVALAAKEGGVPGTAHAGFNDARVHVRGSYNRLGRVVPRGFPEIIAGRQPPSIHHGSGRAELADWITRNDHPLTPRVIVNRIWMHHFGAGIVRTPGDFGRQGQPPTHPLLLDWLSTRFIESGWSIKALHRLMMLSSVYQQSSSSPSAASSSTRSDSDDADPDNRLLARMTSRRQEFEVIRDTLLFVSGRLDRRMQGPAAPRYPNGYSRAERKPPQFSNPRRTLYLMSIRGEYSDGPFVLDAANPNRLMHQRSVSTTAPQALMMINDPFVQSLAKSLRDRVLAWEVSRTEDRITAVYELLFARPAEPRELLAGRQFLSSISDKSRAWQQYCHALMCSNELIYRN